MLNKIDGLFVACGSFYFNIVLVQILENGYYRTLLCIKKSNLEINQIEYPNSLCDINTLKIM